MDTRTGRLLVALLWAGLTLGCGGDISGNRSGTAPAPPAALSGTAGDQQVSLTWSLSTGATGYHLKRSTTSGGPYTQVSAPTSNSFTDTGLTNGTSYFYVVSAMNASGESTNSQRSVDHPECARSAAPWRIGRHGRQSASQLVLDRQ